MTMKEKYSQEEISVALWHIASSGLASFTQKALADALKCPIHDIETLFQKDHDMLLFLIYDTVQKSEKLMEMRAKDPLLSIEESNDLLFDAIMTYIDVLSSHKNSVTRLWKDTCLSPSLLLKLSPHHMKITKRILTSCGINNTNWHYELSCIGYAIFFLNLLSTWIHDDTPDASKTMERLQKGLHFKIQS